MNRMSVKTDINLICAEEPRRNGVKMVLLKQELKAYSKTLAIWMMCIGVCCFSCLLLFESLKDSMGEMADMFSMMGGFSMALGMDQVNIGTIEGFYATEVALIFALGGAMFAAMTGAAILSKEEEGHTADFLHTLPFGRDYIVLWKYAAVCLLCLLFSAGTMLWILLGFLCMGEMPPVREFFLYHGAQLLLQLELGSICFLISAVGRKRQIGGALGIAVLLYFAELMCRVVPAIENLKYVTPYYFANASDIFSTGKLHRGMAVCSVFVTIISAFLSLYLYRRKDLAA